MKDITEFNMYDKVDYLFDQDLFIKEENGDLIIDHHESADKAADTIILDLWELNKTQYVTNADVQILTNDYGQTSIAWTRKGSHSSTIWRKDAEN